MKFKYPFGKIDPNIVSNSQAGQDLFVIAMLQGKRNGTFLEIGCSHPRIDNNTFILEKFYNFSGSSIDVEDEHEVLRSLYNRLKGPGWPQELPNSFYDLPDWVKDECKTFNFDLDQSNWETWKNRPGANYIIADAVSLDYTQFSYHYDYLQIDIDPPLNNLKVLSRALDNHRYSVITFEHDAWTGTVESKLVRDKSREIFQLHGYELVVNDVTIDPTKLSNSNGKIIAFEDWYVDPDVIPRDVIDAYKWIDYSGAPKYYTDILFC